MGETPGGVGMQTEWERWGMATAYAESTLHAPHSVTMGDAVAEAMRQCGALGGGRDRP